MSSPLVPDPLAPVLGGQAFAVLDGGLATELEARGAEIRDSLWSARMLFENPALIRAVHQSYLAAGADIITTASYQATVPGLTRQGISAARAGELIASSATLAQEARAEFLSGAGVARRPLVAGSIGPYGAYLSDGSEYTGDYRLTSRELKAFHRDRLSLLIGAGVDLIGCETIPSLREAEAIVDLLEAMGGFPAWVSFATATEETLADGTPFAPAVASVQQSTSVVAVGVNCLPTARVAPLLERAETGKPLIVYPNAGGEYDAVLKVWRGVPETDAIAGEAERWHSLGARVIGGCCRTGPPTTAALRRLLGPENHEPAP